MRRLRTVGIVAPTACNGSRVLGHRSEPIYDALRRLGFRETPWQFVYHGQVGGLVLPYRGGLYEIHVRFYSDHVFAELEIGRYYVSHFLCTRYNANAFLVAIIDSARSDLTATLLELTQPRLMADEESALERWDPAESADPYSRARRDERMLELLAMTLLEFGWRPLLGVMLVSMVGIAALWLQSTLLFALGSAGTMAVYWALPRRTGV